MKRPIGAGFRFWRFQLRPAVLRPSAVGSRSPGRWPIRSLLTQNGPHFHCLRQPSSSLSDSCAEPLFLRRFRLFSGERAGQNPVRAWRDLSARPFRALIQF
jgi:hypothetical protein